MATTEFIEFSVFSKRAQRNLRRASDNLRNLRPLFRAVHDVMYRSTMKNFDEGGRKPKWKKRTRQYLWPILQKTRALRRSIRKGFEGGMPVLTTAVKYAGFHQFGAPKGNLPARPFFVFRREDREAIRKLVEQHIGKGAM